MKAGMYCTRYVYTYDVLCTLVIRVVSHNLLKLFEKHLLKLSERESERMCVK